MTQEQSMAWGREEGFWLPLSAVMALLCDSPPLRTTAEPCPTYLADPSAGSAQAILLTAWHSPGSVDWGLPVHLGAGEKGCEVVMVVVAMQDACMEHQGASLELCVPAHLEGRASLLCAEAETRRGKVGMFLLPAPLFKPKALSPWKPGQLFLLAEGLSPDWNDSFELEDIISLVC